MVLRNNACSAITFFTDNEKLGASRNEFYHVGDRNDT